MSRFAIACSVCGKYAEGKTGFFARKKIECSCGNIIEVRTDKLAATQCPYCGNEIVFDQTKGVDALCPVCQSKVNTLADQQARHLFSCKQCGVRLSTSGSAATYVCPVCDYENDVQEQPVSEKIKRDGLANIITYKEASDQRRKQRAVEKAWLHYYNQVLFEKGLITEQERNRMTNRINSRGGAAR